MLTKLNSAHKRKPRYKTTPTKPKQLFINLKTEPVQDSKLQKTTPTQSDQAYHN